MEAFSVVVVPASGLKVRNPSDLNYRPAVDGWDFFPLSKTAYGSEKVFFSFYAPFMFHVNNNRKMLTEKLNVSSLVFWY